MAGGLNQSINWAVSHSAVNVTGLSGPAQAQNQDQALGRFMSIVGLFQVSALEAYLRSLISWSDDA